MNDIMRDRLSQLANEHGVENLRQLSIKAGIHHSNLCSNLNGQYGMSIRRMFKIADALECDIVEVIKVLYPEEYAENQKTSR